MAPVITSVVRQVLRLCFAHMFHAHPLRVNAQELTPHALYMRLKRMRCPTAAGRCSVSGEIQKQWQQGDRDELSLALVRALKIHGYDAGAKTRTLVRVRALEPDR